MNRDAFMKIFESEPPYSEDELMKDTGQPTHIANIMFPLAGDMDTAAKLTEKQ